MGKHRIKIIVGFLISGVFLYFAFKGIEVRKLWETFKQINYWWLIPFGVITIVGMYIRAIRWKYLLRGNGDFKSHRLFSPLMIGFMMNGLFPLRLGEFARAYIMGRKENFSKTTAFATVVLERAFDGITLIVCLVLVVCFMPEASSETKIDNFTFAGRTINLDYDMLVALSKNFIIFIIVCLVGIVFLAIEKTREFFLSLLRKIPAITRTVTGFALKIVQRESSEQSEPHKENFVVSFLGKIPVRADKATDYAAKLIEHFAKGFHSLRDVRTVLWIMFYSFLVWALVGLSLQMMSWGFDTVSVSFYQGIAITVVICLAIMIPAAPGYWGTYEIGCIFALFVLGIQTDQSVALAYSLVIHSVQMFPIIAIGLYFLWAEGLSFKEISAQVGEETEQKSGKGSANQ